LGGKNFQREKCPGEAGKSRGMSRGMFVKDVRGIYPRGKRSGGIILVGHGQHTYRQTAFNWLQN